MLHVRIAVVCCLYFVRVVHSNRILLAPFPYTSHINELVHIGDALQKNGHTVDIMLPSTYDKIDKYRNEKETGMKLIEYQGKHLDMYTFEAEENPVGTDLIGVPPIVDFRTNVEGFIEFCFNSLEDDEFFSKLKSQSYDLAVVDAFPCTRCFFILFYKLNISYVSLTTQYEPWLLRNPALPSFSPFGLSFPPKSDRMSFVERLANLYDLIDWFAFPGFETLDDDLVRRYAPEMPFVSLNTLAGHSLLWLIDTDVAVDYPRPLMTNEINIGGLATKPSKKLSGSVKDFVASASEKHGVIIASFGSMDILNDVILRKFLQAFQNIPQKVTRSKPNFT